MGKFQAKDIRNIALCGHGSCGKTTIVDKLLALTGAVSGQHSVDDGTSVCDFDEEEKHHKYSIEASFVHFEHKNKRFNLFDTPGYPDYIGQTIGALAAVDTAAIVISAHSGIAVNTRRVFKEAGDRGMGRMIIINGMDDENVDYPGLIANIKEVFGNQCVQLNVPIGSGVDFKGVASTLKVPDDTSGALVDPSEINEALIESIIEVDEEVTERYFEGQTPTDEEIGRLIVQSISEGSLIPIVSCSAKMGVGLDELLDAMALCAIPADQVKKTASKDGDEVTVEANADGPLVGQVVKTRIDPFVQKLSFIRLYSGTLKKDDTVHVSGARKDIKMGQLLDVQGSETSSIDSASAGDIVAVAKMDDLHTNTSVGDLEVPPIKFPTPMVGLAVTPKSRGDEGKLSNSLNKIVEEDPTITLDRDAQTKELVIHGMSELHLMIVQERLKRRDKVEVETREPKIPYKETIQDNGDGSYRHKKQSGGRGQFGEVHIRMYPLPTGTDVEEFCTKERFPQLKAKHYDEENNFLWVDSVVGGSIPGNFMPAIEKGFKERMAQGVIAGCKVQNVCVEVHFGKHHPVDSSEAAFKTAGSMAFRNVFRECRPSLLEPIVHLDITVPDGNVGDINSDLSTRRGRMLGMDAAGGGMTTLSTEVPLAEVTTYSRNLSSITGGQGSFTMEFSHYDVVPGNVQKEIIDKAKIAEEEE